MSARFDKAARRAATTDLTPAQFRKVNAIKAALGKSDRRVYDHLYSIETFERSALAGKTRLGFFDPEWLTRIAGVRNELQRAHDRLGQLHTGLRAEKRLRAALTELAGAYEAWHYGLTSSNIREIDGAIARMKLHYARAGTLGKAGVADLERGV
jgi:hypothetical protein